MTVQDARNAYNSLSDAEKLQFEGELPSRPAVAGQPTQAVVDFVWRVIIGVFAFVFVAAASGVIFTVVVPFWIKAPGTINTDLLITIFSTTVGFLAGVLTPSPIGSKPTTPTPPAPPAPPAP